MLRLPVVHDLLLQFATALRTSTPWDGGGKFWSWKGKGGGREEFHNLQLVPGETLLLCRSPVVETLLPPAYLGKRITNLDCSCKATGNQLSENEQQDYPTLMKRLLKVNCTIRSITMTLWSITNVHPSLECAYCKAPTPDCLINGTTWCHSFCYSIKTGYLPISDTDILFIEVNYSRESAILPSECKMTVIEVTQQRLIYIQRVKLACRVHDQSLIAMLARDEKFRTFIISLQLFDYGFSLIHEAIRWNWIEMVLLLLETNLNYVLTATTNRGSTAIHQACFHGRFEILGYLIQYGANLFACTKGGYLPFHNACLSFGKNVDVYTAIIGLLLRAMLLQNRQLTATAALKSPSKWCNTSFSIPLYEQECKRLDSL